MNPLLAKIAIPILGAGIAGIAGYAGGVYQVSNRPVEIKTECPQPVCPEFKCPEGNYIDFDKVKNFKGTLKIDQHYHLTTASDSIFAKMLIEDLTKQLNSLRVVKCK